VKQKIKSIVFVFILFSALLSYGQSQESVLKAGTDLEFQFGSKISSVELSASTQENLAVLGKVWGFLKYYHPSIAKGDINWDHELFRILPKIMDGKSQIERNDLILEWIDQLGHVESGQYPAFDTASVKLKPNYNWIDPHELGEKTVKRLNTIKQARRENKHHYVAFDPFLAHPEFINEESYSQTAFPDAGLRLLSLFRFWNIIQYFYPYRYLLDDHWHDVLNEFIPRYLSATNELEYKLVIVQLVARIKDSHGGIYNSPDLEDFKGNFFAPIEITFIEDKPVVTDYLDQEHGVKTGLQKGDVIEVINNRNIGEIILERLPYISASNHAVQKRELAWDLLRTNDPVMTIGYKRNNIPGVLKVKCLPGYQVNKYQRIQGEDSCFTMISPDIAYLYPWTIKAEYIPEIMKSVSGTKGFIIDLRYAPRASLYPLGDYLFTKPQVMAKLTKGSIELPGLFTFFRNIEIGKANDAPYKGKIVILNNEYTQSSCEFTTMALSLASNAIVIGSTTAGADGAVTEVSLPGGIVAQITGSGVYYPDGTETQRIGIVPDIEIKPTIKGIAENRDELLEKAVSLINN
jgi:hypothetical protein